MSNQGRGARSRLSTERIARLCAEHPIRTVAIWALIVVGALVAVSMLLGGVLTSDYTFPRNPEPIVATNQIEELGATDSAVELVVFTVTDGKIATARRLAAMDEIAAQIAELGPDVVSSVVPPSASPQNLIAASRNAAVVQVTMAGDINQGYSAVPEVLTITAAANGRDGMGVAATGLASTNEALNKAAEHDLRVGETYGIGLGLVILLFVFGALVAALVPLILAIVAIIVALALTAIVGQLGELSLFVTNMITMMGLAVGIDYALFIISRFREERAAGAAVLDAIERAGATSSRAVFFSGVTVVVALAGLLVVPMSIFYSLGLGAILVAMCAVAAALTLLPAMLALLGDRVNAGRIPRLGRRKERTARGAWARVVRVVMRHPIISLVLAVCVLAAAAAPYANISTGASGILQFPPDTPTRVAFETVSNEFPGVGITSIRIPALGPADRTDGEVENIRSVVDRTPYLGPISIVPSRTDVEGRIVEIPLKVDGASREAEAAVRNLMRATTLPVGGAAAFNVRYFDVADRYLPIVVAIVLALSFAVLLLAFRSVVIAFKALLLNLLSVGASFGLLTLVFQDGVLASIFGYQKVSAIEAWLPLFLFAVLFGLSMDYHVFLLSRIRERYLRDGDNEGAVIHGIDSSARLITGAALIMVTVFLGFSAGDLVMFQQMGFGLGAAILIDATLIRGIVVPAAMRLLGAWNWYLPSWLSWLPRMAIEATPDEHVD